MFLFSFVDDTNSGRRKDKRMVKNKSRQLPILKEYTTNVFGLIREKLILKYAGKVFRCSRSRRVQRVL